MGRTRMGRTDGRTDGQGGDYMLPRNFSGSIKIFKINAVYLSANTANSVFGYQATCHVNMDKLT